MSEKLYRNKEWLNDQYLNQEKSLRNIANECSVAPITIKRNMDKFSIPTRSISEAKKGKNLREESPNWKGGKTKANGYWYIYKPEHPHRTNRYYVLEHRLVIEKELGRYLYPKEKVHHINKIKTDNRIENLYLCKDNSEHAKIESSLSKCVLKLIEKGYLKFNRKELRYEMIG